MSSIGLVLKYELSLLISITVWIKEIPKDQNTAILHRGGDKL